MNKRIRSAVRWPLVAGYLSIVAVLMACATIGTAGMTSTPASTQITSETLMRLENGAIELRQETGHWTPVGGETTFEIIGRLESTDPWMVTGNTFATRDSTHIDQGLEVGDLVNVKGIVLEDGTWLALSIELAITQTRLNPTIILIGEVSSIDPWVVSGITLNVTNDTLISEGIEPGMIVRVEILLLEDGTWEVLSIVPLGDFMGVPGCATITATVAHVNGNEIQLAGWPVITISDDVKIENNQGVAGILDAGQVVLVVVCASEGTQITITYIIILTAGKVETSPGAEGEKVLICHKPDKKGGHTLSVASAAVPAHLGHGDKLGSCP